MNNVRGRPPANTNTAQSHGLSSVNLKMRWIILSYRGASNSTQGAFNKAYFGKQITSGFLKL